MISPPRWSEKPPRSSQKTKLKAKNCRSTHQSKWEGNKNNSTPRSSPCVPRQDEVRNKSDLRRRTHRSKLSFYSFSRFKCADEWITHVKWEGRRRYRWWWRWGQRLRCLRWLARRWWRIRSRWGRGYRWPPWSRTPWRRIGEEKTKKG